MSAPNERTLEVTLDQLRARIEKLELEVRPLSTPLPRDVKAYSGLHSMYLDSLQAESYKRDFEGIIHEFNLLHNRSNHLLSVEWMLTAFYVAVLAVTLTKIEITAISVFGFFFCVVICAFGFFVARDISSAFKEADRAITTYIRKQCKIEEESPNNFVIQSTSLKRKAHTDGTFEEHENSMRFHRHLPSIFMVFWSVVAVFSLGVAIVKLITLLKAA